VDLNGDGREDLIAIDLPENRLAIYRQSASGFPANPSQMLSLPHQTAWVACREVDPAPGLEILVSTSAGVSYFRRGKDGFEQELQPLIKAEQIFTNQNSPVYVSLPTNASLPIISAGQALIYSHTNGASWRAGEPLDLHPDGSSWFTERNQWTAGLQSARSLRVQESWRAGPTKADTNQLENAGVSKLLEDIGNSTARHLHGIRRVDLNGDRRKDLVIWDFFPGLEPKTDVYVFLRGENGKLPDRPAQVLHCRGMPVPAGSTQEPSPVVDLKGDGTFQLVLVDLATTLTSASSIVDMFLSGGLECALSIRVCSQGAFSASPNASIAVRTIMPVTSLAPVEDMMDWPLFVHGDFNGDGRPDLVVRRSMKRWSILFSATNETWFNPLPAMGFEMPAPGSLEIRDLNGDGLADIVLRAENDPHIFVFLNQLQRKRNDR
jgi:hypothetical protein